MNTRREKRREARIRQRLQCKLLIEGREHSGIVLDLSKHGLFVQTKAKAAPGTPARVELSLPGAGTQFFVEASVVRLNRVPAALAPAWTAGLGLALTRPPPSFLQLVESFARSKAGTTESRAEPARATQSFCVRAALIRGGRTRTVLVRCQSEPEASELALAELGNEWKIVSVEIARS